VGIIPPVEEAADLIRAFASLLWPLIVLLLLITYRPEVLRILRRLKRGRGKILGQELEFELDELETSASQAAEEAPQAQLPRAEVPALPAPEDQPPPPRRPALAEPDDPIERVLTEAAVSPRLGLVTLAAEMERTMRRILAGSQPPENWERRSLPQMIRRIEELPPTLSRAIRQFYEVRSRVVHGHDVEEADVVRTLDSGLTILSALRDLDYEIHEVVHARVEVYGDADGTQAREIHAVILNSYSKTQSRRDVFPTRREYLPGQEVTWEWDFSHDWPESWYRDPDTGEIMHAWTSAAEFAGRPIETVL
jgi:hypothetical protein